MKPEFDNEEARLAYINGLKAGREAVKEFYDNTHEYVTKAWVGQILVKMHRIIADQGPVPSDFPKVDRYPEVSVEDARLARGSSPNEIDARIARALRMLADRRRTKDETVSKSLMVVIEQLTDCDDRLAPMIDWPR